MSNPLPHTNQAYAEAPAVTSQSRPIRAKSVWMGVALPLACAVLLAAAQPFWSAYLSDLVVKIMILSIFALSLHILVGGAGLVSLGHAAYFGLGAYAAVKAAGPDGSNFLVMLSAAVGASGLYALVV
ncbi:MAG: branched-chain amino acid ABC transporter permease, partial [Comamonas sp.]